MKKVLSCVVAVLVFAAWQQTPEYNADYRQTRTVR